MVIIIVFTRPIRSETMPKTTPPTKAPSRVAENSRAASGRVMWRSLIMRGMSIESSKKSIASRA
jgi:hypothetical protein